MDSQTRKQIEKDVYNYTYAASQNRPSFGTFFDKEIAPLLFETDYIPQLKQLIKTYATNKKVLILGASRADVELIIPVTKQIEAIDISEKMVQAISKRYPQVKAFVADAENLDQIKTKYDVIFCKSILHHLHPFEEIVAQLSRRLKPQGILLVGSEPGLYNPFAWFGRTFTPSKEHTPGEKAFNYYQYEQVLSHYFEPKHVRYHFLLSLALVAIPTKLKFLGPVCKALMKPMLKLEHYLQTLKPIHQLYWLTMGVYKLK